MPHRFSRLSTAAVGILLAPLAVLVPAAAHAAPVGQRPPHDKPCSAGLIALTFDDGPARAVTPVLVRTLLTQKVPATFFMVGSRIASAPAVAQLVQRSGFQIGNHTWDHAALTTLSDSAVRHELRSTRREMATDHLVPGDLMRPPYGAINPRVRQDIRGLGLVPVLWTIDSRDWAGGGARQIAGRVLSALRPHRDNIVLQHDGVRNSPASVAAVPEIVRDARRRGYCFTHLGAHGGVVDDGGKPDPTLPVPGTEGPPSARPETAFDPSLVPLPRAAWFVMPVIEQGFATGDTFRILFGSPSGLVVPRS